MMASPARRRTRRRSKADAIPVLFFAGVVGLGVFMVVVHWLLAHLIILVLLATAAAIVGGVGLKERSQRREQRRALAWQQAQITAARAAEIATYHQMSPRQFEEAVAYLCQRDGCTGVQVVGGADDLGADVIATTPDGRRLILQCKRYGPGTMVGSGDVQKVNGTYRDAHGGHLAAIVTTSRFTKPARDYATRVGIGRYDVDMLAGWASRTGPAPWH